MTPILVSLLLAAVRVPAPTILPVDGTYEDVVTVTVANIASGDTTYCSLNARPRRSDAQRYRVPFNIETIGTTSVSCQTFALDGRSPSRVVTRTYTITASAPPPVAGASCDTNPWTGVAYPAKTGPTFYFCECSAGAAAGCQAGSGAWTSASTCTNPAAPCATGWRTAFTSMAAGSTVALCRGGAFANVDGVLNNYNCQSMGASCDLRDYTDSRFTLADPTSQANRPVLVGGDLAHFDDNGASQGYRLFNLRMSNSYMFGHTSGHSTPYVDICNVSHDGGSVAIYWTDPTTNHWALRNSQFAHLSNAVLGGCSDCILDGNYFANTAFDPVDNPGGNHDVYISGESVFRMRVTNNELHACPPGVEDKSATMVVHGQHTDLLIENNLIVCDNLANGSDRQWGISVGHGDYTTSTPAYYRRTIIRNNRIVGSGNFGIEVSQAPDSIIEGNTVTLYPGNPSWNDWPGIVIGENAPRAGNGDDIQNRVTIRNNTIYFPQNAGIGISSRTADPGTGHIITNNVVYNATRAGLTCWDFRVEASAYALLSNNACNTDTGTPWGTTYDTNRVTFTGSPFVGAGTDFTPAAGSVLVNAGTTATTCTSGGAANQPCYSPTAPASVTWSATDTGRSRDAQPDIGAMER